MKTRIFALLIAMMMVLGLFATGATVAFADETAEAAWGTDATNLTKSGTLQEALNTAAADSSITYIRVMNDVSLDSGYLRAIGGKFTLDLNGKTVEGNPDSNSLLYLSNAVNITIADSGTGGKLYGKGHFAISMSDRSNVRLIIAGGTIEAEADSAITLASSGQITEAELIVTGGTLKSNGETSSAIGASGKSVKIKGGSFESGRADIYWRAGTLNIFYHPAPAGITISNGTNSEVDLNSEKIILPEGCYISERADSEPVTVMNTIASHLYYYIAGERVAPPEPEPEETIPEETTPEETTPEETTPEEPAPEETTPEETTTEEPTPEEPTPEETTTEETTPCDHADSAHESAIDNEDGTHTYTCTLCGEENLIEEHNFVEGVCLCSATEVIEPDPNAEAHWGTDAENLTASGTLQEALDAAAADDSTVGYIKVMNDITLDTYVGVVGGDFTFDLNGKTIEHPSSYVINIDAAVNIKIVDTVGNGAITTPKSGASAIVVWTDEIVHITVDGGTLQGGMSAIFTKSNTTVTVTGGTLTGGTSAIDARGDLTVTGGRLDGGNSDIEWFGGTIDFSAHPNPAGITLSQLRGEDVALDGTLVKLPEGYSFYNNQDKREDEALIDGLYTIDQTKYFVTVQDTTDGSFELSTGAGEIPIGTQVIVTATPNDGYLVDEILVNGAAIEGNTFTLTEDAAVTVTFKPHQANWGTDAENLTASGTLQEAFDAAMALTSDTPTVTYIQLVADVYFETDEVLDGLISGTITLDLNGKCISNGQMFVCGADLTVTDTAGGGRIISESDAIHIVNGKLTMLDGVLEGGEDLREIRFDGGTVDLSNYPNAEGICVCTFTESGIDISSGNFILPDRYAFYHGDEREDAVILPRQPYTIRRITQEFSFDNDSDVWGAVEFSTNFEDGNRIPVGETVVIGVSLWDHFSVSLVANEGAVELTYDAESGTYSFVMPDYPVTIKATVKYNAFVWGADKDNLTNSGDLYDLVEAINAGNASYVKVVGSETVHFNRGPINTPITGKAIIDLSNNALFLSDSGEFSLTLAQGADITLYADLPVDTNIGGGMAMKMYEESTLRALFTGTFVVQSGAKLTVDGVCLDSSNIYYAGGVIDVSRANWGSRVWFVNMTENEIALSDTFVLGTRLRALSQELSSSYDMYHLGAIPSVTTARAGESLMVLAVYTVSFDFGEGSGQMPLVNALHYYGGALPMPQNVTHPQGLALVGWRYKYESNETRISNEYYQEIMGDVTLVAEWGAPLYVGGVGMFDGDYLANGATETTQTKPAFGGYAYYKNGVLTLNNFTFTGDGVVTDAYNYEFVRKALIYSAGDLIIELVGDNKFASDISLAYTRGIVAASNLTVRGTGSLQMNLIDSGISCAGNFTVEGGNVTLVLSMSDTSVYVLGNVTIKGGKLSVICDNDVFINGNLTIEGGEFALFGYSDDSDIDVDIDGDLNVSGGRLFGDYVYSIYVYGGFNLSGGEVVVRSYSDSIEVSKDVTITGGKLDIYSDYGVGLSTNSYYDIAMGKEVPGKITITGGEIIIVADENGIFSYADVIIRDAELYIDADCGIYLDAYYDNGEYLSTNLTITNSRVELYGYDVGIYSYNVTITNSEIVIKDSSNGIRSYNMIVTGSTLDFVGCYVGITAFGNISITDSSVSITNSNSGITVAWIDESSTGDITISNSKLEITAFQGIATQGNVTLENALVYIVGEYSVLCKELNISGTKTVVLMNSQMNVTDVQIAAEDFTLQYLPQTSDELPVIFFEGKDVTHSWSTQYVIYDTYHHLRCTDEDCYVEVFGEIFNELYMLHPGSQFGEHVIPEGEIGCSICSPEEADTEIPEDTLISVGENYHLTAGQYLTNNGTIVTEKPTEGGYLYVYVDGTTGYIVLHNFTMELNGLGIQIGFVEGITEWKVVLEGDNTLTVTASDAMQEELLDLNGTGIAIFGCDVNILGDGSLTINAENGIFALTSGVAITDGATVTVNAIEDGFDFPMGYLFVQESTLTVNAPGDDGIYVQDGFVGLVNSTITIVAGDDGIDLDSTYMVMENAVVTIISEDEGIELSETKFEMTFGTKLTVNAGADAIDAVDSIFTWYGGEANLTAVDEAIEFSFDGAVSEENCYFDCYQVTLNLVAGVTGILVEENPNICIDDSTIHISSAGAGFNIYGVISFYDSKINVNSKTNYVDDSGSFVLYGTEMNISATDTAFDLAYDASIVIDEDSTLNITNAQKGIYSEDYAYVVVYSGTLSINAEIIGIGGEDMNLYLQDEGFRVSVKAAQAISLNSLSTWSDFVSNVQMQYDHKEEYDGETYYECIDFVDEAGFLASYVTIQDWQTLANDVYTSIDELNHLIGENGEIQEITGLISDINGMIDTLTNTEGEGRLDLLEAANTAIQSALTALDQKLDTAQKELSDAIASGDEALTAEIEALNKALDDAQAAYAAADKAIDDKLTAAQSALDTAIKAVDKKLDDAKAELEASIAAGNATLTTKIENLNKALDDAEAAYAAADKALDDKLTAAQSTLDTAIKAVDKKLDDAKAELEASIAAGNATLTTEIENLNKAIEDAESAYVAADKALDDKLAAAETTLNAAIAVVDKKVDDAKTALDAAIKAGDDALTAEIETLNKALNDAKSAYAAADKAMSDEVNAKITAAETTVAIVQAKLETAESAISALQSAVEALEQANAANANLKAELDALKGEVSGVDENKASGWQTATTVIAIVGLVCNAGLIAAVIIFECKHKILIPAFKNGFGKVVSKFKKSEEQK